MTNFQTWWHSEGSAMRPLENEDLEEFAKRVTEIAWSNGGFCAIEVRKAFDRATELAEQPAQQEPERLLQEIARLHDRIKDLESDVEFLSQPAPLQQDPVAWMYEGDAEFDGNDWRYPTRVTISKQVADFHGGDIHPLYTTPQAQPSREWVGLTEEEKTELRRKHYPLPLLLMDATEAKLKEKNHD